MRAKIGVYVTGEVAKQLEIAARRSGATKSDIVNEALISFLGPPPQESERDREVLQRVRAMAKKLRHIHREVEIVAETLALFIRYFLMITPPLPESEQDDARKLGRERYEVFVAQVAKRIASDSDMVSEIMQWIAETRRDSLSSDMAQQAAERQEGVARA